MTQVLGWLLLALVVAFATYRDLCQLRYRRAVSERRLEEHRARIRAIKVRILIPRQTRPLPSVPASGAFTPPVAERRIRIVIHNPHLLPKKKGGPRVH